MKKVYILSILMAVIVGVAVFFFASSLEQKALSQSDNNGQVVVAVKEIPANTQITEDMVALAQLPDYGINPSAATGLGQVVGKITRYPILPQEQVLSPRLTEKGKEDGSLSYVLEEGYRAVSVAVDEVAGVSGFINAGDYVDVIATVIEYDATGKSRTVSAMLVENVLVLQTGLKDAKATDSASEIYKTVTLRATPQEALKINYAATNGKLRLLLRAVLDNKAVKPQAYP